MVDYEDLLALFFSFHSPSGFGGSQYRSAIFAHTPEQRDLALKALKGPQRKYEKVVALEDADDFYAGEEYHQVSQGTCMRMAKQGGRMKGQGERTRAAPPPPIHLPSPHAVLSLRCALPPRPLALTLPLTHFLSVTGTVPPVACGSQSTHHNPAQKYLQKAMRSGGPMW